MCSTYKVGGEDTGNEEGLNDDMLDRAPGGIPRCNVNGNEPHLQQQIIKLQNQKYFIKKTTS